MRFRPGVVLALAAAWGAFFAAQAHAAAEVHRLSLVLSGVPTQVKTGDFNDIIDYYNRTVLEPPPRGYDPMKNLGFSWLFDAELRYAVTRNVIVDAGVSQMRALSTKEFLPGISQSIDVRAELLTIPVHLGAAYYMAPYNQGDFQARTFVGGGLISYTHTRTTFAQELTAPDSTTNAQLGGSYSLTSTSDAPGYYAEGGVHMYFASRYSVMLSVLWRSGEVTGMRDERTGQLVIDPVTHRPMNVDVGGIGLRMAAVIGL